MSSETDGHLAKEAIEIAESADDEVELLNLFGEGKQDGAMSQGDALGIVKDFLADAEQWHGKTDIRSHQAQPLAAVHNLSGFYRALGFHEEAEMIDEFMPGYISDYEILLTSIKEHEGDENARNQAERIIESIFGEPAEMDAAARGLGRRLLSGLSDEDE